MPSALKILMLCPRYLWAGGGSVDHARRLCEALAVRGHTLTLATDACETARADAPSGVALLALDRDPAAEAKAQRLLSLEQKRGGYRLAQWLFRGGETRLLAAGPVCPRLADPALYAGRDVVVLLNASSAFSVSFGRVAGKLSALTVVMPLFHVRETSGQWPAYRKLFQGVDLINTSTEFESRWLAERAWGEERLQAIGPGADPSPQVPDPAGFRRRHGIPPTAPIVLFLGRKVFNKGVAHVVQAMDRLWDEHSDAWLVLIGFAHNPPEWLGDLLAGLRHAGGQQVVDIDNATDAEREDALAACTVMAAPSISDSFGIVYLDAWRHRKPVIACLDTACASVVRHGTNGFLVPFGDVPSLGNTLRDLFRDPENAVALGEAGHALWKERYTWPEIARRTENLFVEHMETV